MKFKNYLLTLLISYLFVNLMLFTNCSSDSLQNEKSSISSDSLKYKDYQESVLDKSKSRVIADTILYSVVIKNPDSLDEWASECLRRTDVKAFADIIFNSIYEKKLAPYNYNTEIPMTIPEVKALEKEFPRTQIGKVFFKEEWYFDSSKMKFYKKVNALMLAYELYNRDGSVRSYKAGVLVFLNDSINNKINL